MAIIYQTNDPQNRVSKTTKVVRKIIRNAFFALRIDKPEYEGEEKNYTVVSGDTLSNIASANNTTVDDIKTLNSLKNDNIQVGQQLKLSSQKKKGDKVTFKYINNAKVGETVYMVVETENANGLNLKANIKQGAEKGIVDIDQPLSILQDDNEVVLIKMQVGAYSNDDNIINKDDYKDKAIAKITLQPKEQKKLEDWNEKLEKLKDKKSKFYILVEADTSENDLVSYHGTNPEDEDKPPHQRKPQRWLDMEGKWFEIIKVCNCGKAIETKMTCVKYGTINPIYGPKYTGEYPLSSYTKWENLIANKKITNDEKDILIAMSENEGNMDSIQSYDSEILSFGVMQKTINSDGYGEFPIQVLEFKEKFPKKYEQLFSQCGWTVEKDKTNKAIMYYTDPTIIGSEKITGAKLKEKIREGFNEKTHKTKISCFSLAHFIKTGKDIDFQSKQIEDFVYRLNKKVLDIKPTGYEYSISSYIKTKLGKATVLDHHVNRPNHVKIYFGEALDQFFKKKDDEIIENNREKSNSVKKDKISKNPSDWGTMHNSYEKEILEIYGPLRGKALGEIEEDDAMTDAALRYTKLKNKL